MGKIFNCLRVYIFVFKICKNNIYLFSIYIVYFYKDVFGFKYIYILSVWIMLGMFL